MTGSVSELRRQFGSIATLYPYAKGPVLTVTVFGSCLSDNVEVPCSAALGRLFDQGWKSWRVGRDEEIMGILDMLKWLGVLYRIRQSIPSRLCVGVLTFPNSPGFIVDCLLRVRTKREGEREIHQALWRIQSLGSEV